MKKVDRLVQTLIPIILPKQKKYQTNLSLPIDAFEAAQVWLNAHYGHSLHSMIFCGLKALGIGIDDSLLTPKISAPYKRRIPKRNKQHHVINLKWPIGAFEAAQVWLNAHYEHSLHSMVFCGLKALGVEIDDSLLTPKKRKKRKGE